MGVTIHFEGRLKSDSDFDTVMNIAQDFATENAMEFEFFSESAKELDRVKDEKEWNYSGPTRGIKIQPDENSDPLWLEFDRDNYVQEYCKTQFAGVQAHVLVIQLLRKIQPCFIDFMVTDEGEFWDTDDIEKLQNSLDSFYDAVEKAKAENPKLNGPYRLEDGRLIDLME